VVVVVTLWWLRLRPKFDHATLELWFWNCGNVDLALLTRKPAPGDVAWQDTAKRLETRNRGAKKLSWIAYVGALNGGSIGAHYWRYASITAHQSPIESPETRRMRNHFFQILSSDGLAALEISIFWHAPLLSRTAISGRLFEHSFLDRRDPTSDRDTCSPAVFSGFASSSFSCTLWH
jgi:hypothetical protein